MKRVLIGRHPGAARNTNTNAPPAQTRQLTNQEQTEVARQQQGAIAQHDQPTGVNAGDITGRLQNGRRKSIHKRDAPQNLPAGNVARNNAPQNQPARPRVENYLEEFPVDDMIRYIEKTLPQRHFNIYMTRCPDEYKQFKAALEKLSDFDAVRYDRLSPEQVQKYMNAFGEVILHGSFLVEFSREDTIDTIVGIARRNLETLADMTL